MDDLLQRRGYKRELGQLQMTPHIHVDVQNSYDCNAERRDAEVNHVSLDTAATIARPDVVTSRRRFGRLRELGEGCFKDVDVPISLLETPLSASVSPDTFQIALGRRRKTIFSHGRPASSP